MKTFFIAILATVLSGCAVTGQDIANNFASGLQAATQAPQTQPYSNFSTNVTGIQTTDNQCVARCTKAGNQYGLCVKNCSY